MLPDLEPFLPRVRALFPDTRGHGLSQKFERAEDYTYPIARCGRPVLSHTVCGRAGSAPALDACPLLTREALPSIS
jgi:hypothetical protein